MSNALAVLAARDVVTEKDLEILKNSKFRDFTPDEMAYCARISNALALNPLLNQIHFVKRKNKDGTSSITAQTAIDGFRLAAHRTGAYAGSDEPRYEYKQGDQVQKKPQKATVTVYKMIQTQRCAFTGEARWDEFYNPIGGQWDKMPHVMLSKCAEAQALRKAFPAELSNVYTPEEMDQADRPNKAQEIQEKVKPEPKEVPSEVHNPPQGKANCLSCGSLNLMLSKYEEGVHYCRDCKKTQPVGAA
jgi:phage recombination protein Bet